MATSGARLILDTARAGLATLARVTYGQQARACMDVRTALDWMARYVETTEADRARLRAALSALTVDDAPFTYLTDAGYRLCLLCDGLDNGANDFQHADDCPYQQARVALGKEAS